MAGAAKLARQQRKAQLAERVDALREWRFQELPAAAAAGEGYEQDAAMVRPSCSSPTAALPLRWRPP